MSPLALLKKSQPFIYSYLFVYFSWCFSKPRIIVASSCLTVSVMADGGMYGGALVKADRYSALKSTADEICASLSHLEATKIFKK